MEPAPTEPQNFSKESKKNMDLFALLQNLGKKLGDVPKQIKMFLQKYTYLAVVLFICSYLIPSLFELFVAPVLQIIFKPLVYALGSEFVANVILMAFLISFLPVLVYWLFVFPSAISSKTRAIKFIFCISLPWLLFLKPVWLLISKSSIVMQFIIIVTMLFVSFFLSFMYYEANFPLSIYFSKLKKYFWGIFTVCLIAFILLLGSYLISLEFQYLTLNEETNNSFVPSKGEMSCISQKGTSLVNEKLYCKLNPELNDASGNVTFDFKNGTTDTVIMQDLSFVAPPNVKHVVFRIIGIDSQGKKRFFSVGGDYRFLDETESQTRTKASTYILALLAIVFFSIPSMMVNMKKLCETNKSEQNDDVPDHSKPQGIDVSPQDTNAASKEALDSARNK